MKWRPIKTAPTDERAILVYQPGFTMNHGGYSIVRRPYRCNPPATHWMPLPKPPRGSAAEHRRRMNEFYLEMQTIEDRTIISRDP